jgi:RNA-directed DNA polymerase
MENVKRNNLALLMYNLSRSLGGRAALRFPRGILLSGLDAIGDTRRTQGKSIFVRGAATVLKSKKSSIYLAIREEAYKLIRRHQKYASDLAAAVRRREKRSGVPQDKHVHLPEYWSAAEGFNPYHVFSHAAGVAYAIDKALATGQYKPRSAVVYSLGKPDRGIRDVSVFQVADNALSRLTFHRLIEKNARHLSSHAYAYRRDLTIHDAVLHISSDINAKSRIFVAEFDFRKFFDSISHEHIRRVLKDQRFFITERESKVTDAFLRAPALKPAEYREDWPWERDKGIPQGTSISLFLANIAAYPLDRKLESLGVGFARYADDTLIWGDSYDIVCRAVNSLEEIAADMGVELNFNKSEGISILCPEDLAAEFKAKSAVSFIGYRIGSKLISFAPDALKRSQNWLSYLIYSNLLQEPKKGRIGSDRLTRDMDWDYVVMLAQIRRYLYGELSESQLRKYIARQTPLMRYHGLMSFYPVVNDDALLRKLDGWLLNSVWRSLRLRAKLLKAAGFTILPAPHGLSKNDLVKLRHITREGKRIDLRFPSIARVARLIRRASKTYGASAVAGPGSNEYYAG